LARQLRLSLKQPPSWAREDFVVSPANADGVRLLDAWPAWPGGVLALVGPEGTGKTHLAMAWAQKTDAVLPARNAPVDLANLPGHTVLIENAENAVNELSLFHLINMAAQHGGGLLLTSRLAPREWPSGQVPDLRSRLNALPVAELDEPDDAILLGVLRKLFRERNIRPTEDTYPYLLRRMERSVVHAKAIVRQLDEAADALQRPVSRALAKEVLEAGDATMDLF
jgi:chromosomal replication initiation ATPase DnaA